MATAVRRSSDMSADSVKFRGTSLSFTATAGTTTTGDHKVLENRLLDGVGLLIKDAAWGDSLRLQVVDVDNLLGAGANYVLDEFATTWLINPQAYDQGFWRLEYSAEIPAGFYIRIIYNSVGGTNVGVGANLFLHKNLL
jgi:hypothetical protein